MAVYAAARRAGAGLPRRRPAPRARARRHANPLGVTLAAIVTSFLLGLFYLTQTIHVAASGYAIDALQADVARLTQQAQSLRGEIARWAAEPAIVDSAQQSGLGRLGDAERIGGD